MFLYALAFLAGALSLLLIGNKDQATVLILIASLLLVFFVSQILINKDRLSYKRVLFGCFCAGIIWSNSSVLFWFNHSKTYVEQPVVTEIEGVICSIPSQQQQSWRFDLCIDSIADNSLPLTVRNRVKVFWGEYSTQPLTALKAGQQWRLNVKLRPIHGRVNSVGFDFEKWLVAEGYLATASVRKNAKLLASSSQKGTYQRLRQKAYEHFMRLLPESDYQPLMLALLMGERATISDQQWSVLQQSGTAHLLAISGLHIGIAALWSYWLVFYLWRLSARLCQLIPAQNIAEGASLLGATTMVLLSGFGLPAQRALTMIFIFMLSRWLGFHLKLTNIIGWALIITLITQPFAVLQTGFWLSFSAVLIIALILNRQIIQPKSWINWLRVNGYLYIAVIPIGWHFFDNISWVALLANLILIPLTSFVLTPLLYLGALISALSESLASVLFVMADWITQISYLLQSQFASLNLLFSDIAFDRISFFLMCLIVSILLLPRRIFTRWIFLPIVLIAILPSSAKVEKPMLTMVVFDIGQGLAIYIDTPQGNLLYDTGWGHERSATANSTLLPFFKRYRIKHIDKLIISHGDADHSGGLAAVMGALEVSSLISGEPLPGVASHDCHLSAPWQWGPIRFEFLKSTIDDELEGNNLSCVISISTPDHRILLTGDIEKQSEQQLLNNGLSAHDILIVPHHGSETSSTESFIERLHPQQAIFSTGYDNQWKFPRTPVVERYRNIGSHIWITHLDGAVTVMIDDSGQLRISAARQEDARFWR